VFSGAPVSASFLAADRTTTFCSTGVASRVFIVGGEVDADGVVERVDTTDSAGAVFIEGVWRVVIALAVAALQGMGVRAVGRKAPACKNREERE